MITKELQNLAWSVLPKEFKEEVKGQYSLLCQFNNVANAPAKDELEYLFGRQNLTSDTQVPHTYDAPAPYTEPADHIADNGKMVDRRLNIATAILENLIKSQYYSLSDRDQENNIKEMAKVSARLTDAIIAELNESAVHKQYTSHTPHFDKQ